MERNVYIYIYNLIFFIVLSLYSASLLFSLYIYLKRLYFLALNHNPHVQLFPLLNLNLSILKSVLGKIDEEEGKSKKIPLNYKVLFIIFVES
jgi:hypothetical protein